MSGEGCDLPDAVEVRSCVLDESENKFIIHDTILDVFSPMTLHFLEDLVCLAVPAAVARLATPKAVAKRIAPLMTNLRILSTRLSSSKSSSECVKSSSGVAVLLGTFLEGMYLFPLLGSSQSSPA